MIVVALFAAALVLVLIGLLAKRNPPDPPDAPTKTTRRAYVLGVNYGSENALDDEGCWKVVSDYAAALRKSDVFEDHEVLKYTDDRTDGKHYTSRTGMQKLLSRIADRSYRDDVSLVYVHFCGRGTTAGIETSDGEVIGAEWLAERMTSFSPGTRVVVTFDCQFNHGLAKMGDRAVTFLSGESITHALLDAAQYNPRLLGNVFYLREHIQHYIGKRPRTCATHDIFKDAAFLPSRT